METLRGAVERIPKLSWVASLIDEVALELWASWLAGAVSGHDDGGFVHVTIDTRAKCDVGVDAAVPSVVRNQLGRVVRAGAVHVEPVEHVEGRVCGTSKCNNNVFLSVMPPSESTRRRHECTCWTSLSLNKAPHLCAVVVG